MLAGPLVVALAASWWYLTSGRYVSTDDAYVQAARTMVSSDISGRVVEVLVHDNERLGPGLANPSWRARRAGRRDCRDIGAIRRHPVG